MSATTPNHVVHCYEDERVLADAMASFVITGLGASARTIMLTTPERRDRLALQLEHRGVDLSRVVARGAVEIVNAAETLATIMNGDDLDRRRLKAAVDSLVPVRTRRTAPPLHTYGEMVDMLCQHGKFQAAIDLDDFWNDLALRRDYRLLCACSLQSFRKEPHRRWLGELQRRHGRVEPPEAMSTAMREDALRGYSIQAFARLSGASPDLIRAWERRYQAFAPIRDDRGRRLYTRGDVERLRLLRHAVADGHPIRRVAGLSTAELRTMTRAAVVSAPADATQATVRRVTEHLLSAEPVDPHLLEHELGAAALLLSPPQFIHDVVTPLVSRVGHAWSTRRLSVAREHMLSFALRNVFSILLRATPRRGAAKVLLGTPAGERHEFGVLSAAVLAQAAGWDPIVLGIDVPALEIICAAQSYGVRVVVLGIVTEDPAVIGEVRTVAEKLPQRVSCILGGAGVLRDRESFGSRTTVVRDLRELEAELNRLRPQ